jgi:hypothetical protein
MLKSSYWKRLNNTPAAKARRKEYAKTYRRKFRDDEEKVNYYKKMNNSPAARQRRVDWIRKNYHQWKYGLSINDVETLFVKQDGKCAICGEAFKNRKTLCVDHDHSTGNVRNLLCKRCNLGLGHFRENGTPL